MKMCNSEIAENSNASSHKILKAEHGCNLFVRLIGEPVRITKIVSHSRRHAIIESEDVGRLLREKYPHKLSRVYIRYACWCIDRIDCSLKILDMPVSVARELGNRQVIVGKDIAGTVEGCDWYILANGKKGMNVKYDDIYLNESPLTEFEIQMVEHHKSGQDGIYDLAKIFKSCGFKESEEILFNI